MLRGGNYYAKCITDKRVLGVSVGQVTVLNLIAGKSLINKMMIEQRLEVAKGFSYKYLWKYTRPKTASTIGPKPVTC